MNIILPYIFTAIISLPGQPISMQVLQFESIQSCYDYANDFKNHLVTSAQRPYTKMQCKLVKK